MNATNVMPDVPSSDALRDRLAVVMTEAALLKAQLKVSTRVERERERLKRLVEQRKQGGK
jgi:hypothetical protein